MTVLSSSAELTGCSAVSSGPQFIGLRDFANWARATGESPREIVLTSPEIAAERPWNELIPSWNADTPPGASLHLEARAVYPDHVTKYYDLGYWAGNGHTPPRTSRTRQKDADGNVDTDTLLLTRPAERVQLRLTLARDAQVRFVSLSLIDSQAAITPREPNTVAWGIEMPVPERSQLSYEGGSVWCSPTSVTMVMRYWAEKMQRPEWNVEVPDAAQGIYDVAWQGTGNWPFNTAYAGSFPGLYACVARERDLRALEDSIVQGIPVVTSVSYDSTVGGDTPGSNGHLVVCIGFTPTGDPIINDPWAHLDQGETVRRVFRRDRFQTMWGKSKNTVYFIYPKELQGRIESHQ